MENLKLRPEILKRVYVDISEETERKTRIRYVQLEAEKGIRFNRKSYIEYLIEQDTAKVNGATLRVINASRQKPKKD